MKRIKNGLASKVLSVVLICCMLLGIMPGGVVAAAASNDSVLATISSGQIWEFRNLTDRELRLEFTGDEYAFVDFYTYDRNGMFRHKGRGASPVRPRVGAGVNRLLPGGMMVMEHRTGGNITVSGDAANIQVRRLQTPVFYVQVISEGVTVTFTNHSSEQQPLGFGHQGFSGDRNVLGRLWGLITVTRFNADGTVHGTGVSQISDGASALAGARTELRGNRSTEGWSRDVFGPHTSFSGQPYRLTIDGQRSFPPGAEQELPTTPQPPGTNNITLNDIALYSEEARIIFNMMRRTNFATNPWSGYSYARQIAADRGSGNAANMQRAYYSALIAMLNGDANTHEDSFNALRNTVVREAARLTVPIIGKLAGGSVGGAAGTFVVEVVAGRSVELSRHLQIALEEMYLLMMLYEHANANLRVAITSVLQTHYQSYHNEIVLVVASAAGKTASSLLASDVLEQVFGGPLGSAIKNVNSIVGAARSILTISRDAGDRILAMEGIRRAAWGAYGQIVNEGRPNNQFTEANLLLAYSLFVWLHHLTAEQTGNDQSRSSWVAMARPIPVGGGFRWDTERLTRERDEVQSIGRFPSRYPFSWNTVNADPAAIEGYDRPAFWALEYVLAGISMGIVPRSLQNNYDQAITRAEFAALAVALYENRRGEITGRVTFADTNDVNVQKAAYLGIVRGRDGNNFDPNGTITREESAALLSRTASALGRPLPNRTPTFNDVMPFPMWWSFNYIGQVQAAGIMGGIGSNNFAPMSTFSREQSIITIMRLLEFIR